MPNKTPKLTPAHDSMRQALLSVLDEGAHARELTAEKAAHIMARDGSWVSGFVLSTRDGKRAIVECSAVRWLSKDDMWNLMHPNSQPSTPKPSTAS